MYVMTQEGYQFIVAASSSRGVCCAQLCAQLSVCWPRRRPPSSHGATLHCEISWTREAALHGKLHDNALRIIRGRLADIAASSAPEFAALNFAGS